MIDHWFSQHEIVTHREPTVFVRGKKLVPVWYVPHLNLYVEFLDLIGELAYNQRWDEKQRLYDEGGLRCMTLDEHDLADLDASIVRTISELRARGGRR